MAKNPSLGQRYGSCVAVYEKKHILGNIVVTVQQFGMVHFPDIGNTYNRRVK